MGADRRPRNKNLGGRPRAEIDYPQLIEMCGLMCTGEECASILGIDYDTLNKALIRDGHGGFTEFFKKHSAQGKISLRRAQLQTAKDGSVPMQIWLGKQYLGQREPDKQVQDDGITELLRQFLSGNADG